MKRLFVIGAILFSLTSYSYAASPIVLYQDITSGPNSGGEGGDGCYLSLYGKNFGASQGTSTVTINGTGVNSYTYWSDEWVSVQPGSSVSTGSVVLTTSEGSSTAPDGFTVRTGEIFYVDDGGTDSGSTCGFSAPCLTPDYVHDLAGFGAGDFLYVRGGTYTLSSGNTDTSRWVSATKDGSSGSPITFSGYPGETVTVNVGTSYALWQQPSSNHDRYYWNLANFTDINIPDLTGNINNPIHLGASSSDMRKVYNFRVVNIDIQGGGNAASGASPFEIGRCQDTKLFGIKIHDSAQTGPSNTHFIYFGGEDITNVELGWFEISDCTYGRAALQVHSDGNWAADEKLDEITIHDGLISNVPAQALLTDQRVEDVLFYNIIIADANQDTTSPTSVISFRGDNSDGDRTNVIIYNSVVYADGGSSDKGIFEFGLSSSDHAGTVTLYNNIFYLTDGANEGWDDGYGLNYIGSGNVTIDYNDWHGNSDSGPSYAGSNKVTTDPSFVSAESGNFRLNEGSDCIDAGTSAVSASVTRDFDGSTWAGTYEIGAFMYGSAPSEVSSSIPLLN